MEIYMQPDIGTAMHNSYSSQQMAAQVGRNRHKLEVVCARSSPGRLGLSVVFLSSEDSGSLQSITIY
jgi:hypothetical protein